MLTFIIFNTMVSSVGENVKLHKISNTMMSGVGVMVTLGSGRCSNHCDCRTSAEGLNTKQVPCLGSEQGENEDQFTH